MWRALSSYIWPSSPEPDPAVKEFFSTKVLPEIALASDDMVSYQAPSPCDIPLLRARHLIELKWYVQTFAHEYTDSRTRCSSHPIPEWVRFDSELCSQFKRLKHVPVQHTDGAVIEADKERFQHHAQLRKNPRSYPMFFTFDAFEEPSVANIEPPPTETKSKMRRLYKRWTDLFK